MKQSFIICGAIGSGKWTVWDYISRHTGGSIFTLSNIPGNFLRAFDIRETRGNYAKMSWLLRSTFWEDIFLRAIERFIANSHDTILIFDWPRKVNVIEKIQELTESTLIYIDTPPKIRYERIHMRWEKHDEISLTFEQFLEQEGLTTEKELEEIRKMADIVIENMGKKEELFERIDILASIHSCIK